MAKPAREQMYFVIVIPVNKEGQGPCDLKDAVKLTWEVWDQVLTSYSSHDFLADAIDDMNRRNEEHDRLLKEGT